MYISNQILENLVGMIQKLTTVFTLNPGNGKTRFNEAW